MKKIKGLVGRIRGLFACASLSIFVKIRRKGTHTAAVYAARSLGINLGYTPESSILAAERYPYS